MGHSLITVSHYFKSQESQYINPCQHWKPDIFFPEIRRLTSLNKNKSPKHDFQKVFNSDLNQMKPIDHRNLLVTQQPIAMGGKRN